MVFDVDVVQHLAESAERYSHAVGAAEATELAASLYVRFEIEEDAGDSSPLELPFQLRDQLAEVAQDSLVAAISLIGRNKVLERLFVDVPLASIGPGCL